MSDMAVDGAQVAAAAIATLALVWGVFSFRQTSRLAHYTELDRLYFDIVALRVANTHLGDRRLIPLVMEDGSERALRYDSYALLIWNFIETIYDRCKQRGLFETWRPILEEEGELHRQWFATNLDKFKLRFRKWASGSIPKLDTLVDSNGMAKPGHTSVPARAGSTEAPHYDAMSVDLSKRLLETIAAWRAARGVDVDETSRNWRTAEALHLVTWAYPHTHAPLSLLLDEERISSPAPAVQQPAGAGTAPIS